MSPGDTRGGAERGWLEAAGAAVCAPALGAAAALYLVVTWAPDGLAARDRLCACLVLLGLGGAAASGHGGRRPVKRLGALAMLAGAAGLVAVGRG